MHMQQGSGLIVSLLPKNTGEKHGSSRHYEDPLKAPHIRSVVEE